MDDVISRQEAIELIHNLYPSSPIMRRNRERWMLNYKPYIEVEKALEMLPSAQPEIVRCKDCICAHSEVWLSGGGKSEGYAYGYCGKTNLKILPYDFCSRAERRTDE